MSNDNDKGGKPPSTLVVPDKRVVDLTGKPLAQGPSSVQNVSQIPQRQIEERTFQFQLTDGQVIQKRGFLVATSSFIGVGVGEGEIVLIVPTGHLHFVNEIEQEPTALEQFPDPQGVA